MNKKKTKTKPMSLLNSSPLKGQSVSMYDAKTNKKIGESFESISKAGRYCGIMSSAQFSQIVYKRKTIKVPRLSNKEVYFKEE